MIGARDGEWVCIANNPGSGVSTWVMPDPNGGPDDALIQERQDVRALLDENTAIRNVASASWKGDGLHSVARLPISMVHDRDSYIGGAIDAGDDKAVTKFLNDSNNERLRTKEGML